MNKNTCIEGYKLNEKARRFFLAVTLLYLALLTGSMFYAELKLIVNIVGFLFAIVVSIAIAPTLAIWQKQEK